MTRSMAPPSGRETSPQPFKIRFLGWSNSLNKRCLNANDFLHVFLLIVTVTSSEGQAVSSLMVPGHLQGQRPDGDLTPEQRRHSLAPRARHARTLCAYIPVSCRCQRSAPQRPDTVTTDPCVRNLRLLMNQCVIGNNKSNSVVSRMLQKLETRQTRPGVLIGALDCDDFAAARAANAADWLRVSVCFSVSTRDWRFKNGSMPYTKWQQVSNSSLLRGSSMTPLHSERRTPPRTSLRALCYAPTALERVLGLIPTSDSSH